MIFRKSMVLKQLLYVVSFKTEFAIEHSERDWWACLSRLCAR